MSIDELSGSPTESLDESSGSTAERKFLVPWNSRLTFAQNLVGTGYSNFPQSRIISIDLQPWSEELVPSGTITDASLQTADYADQPCLVTAKYGPDFTQKAWPTDMPKPTFRAGTELRYQIDGSAQFLVLPFGGMKWLGTGAALKNQENSRILIPIREIELQWDFVDDPPLDTLDGLVGAVNDATFLGCEAETLLLETYSVVESFRAAPLNPHTNRLVLNFRKRRIEDGASVRGWNHDYREAEGATPAGWDKVIFQSDDSPRYTLKTMTNMFA